MTDPTNDRKLEHVRVIQGDRDTDRRGNHWDRIHLTHRALPELDLDDVDPSLDFFGKRLSFPLLISSMTGGDNDLLRDVNRNLAIAAETCGVAMGVGSQRVMFAAPEARASFACRDHAPTALLFANLGAVQLNMGFGVDECREAIDAVGTDGLYLHLNPLQEAVQPEGDTCFGGLAARIAAVTAALDVPVLAKEVGAGLSVPDARLLLDAGVRVLDVAGTGGTSWSRIEHHRAGGDGLGLLFQDWGIPTPRALADLAAMPESPTLIASGGIRSALDMLKATILGATLSGIASPFLEPAMDSAEAVIARIRETERAFRTGMFLLGASTLADLRGNHALLRDPPGGAPCTP